MRINLVSGSLQARRATTFQPSGMRSHLKSKIARPGGSAFSAGVETVKWGW
jgi:hypothetical protein